MKIKPLGRKAYGSIPHLSGSRLGPGDHRIEEGQERIATKEPRDWKDLVIVQEKVDGSCCSVAKVDGQILALGRAGYLAQTSPYEQHQRFADWVRKNEARFDRLLKEGERVVGEWLLQAHGTRYELSHEPFVVFDILRDSERMTYLNFLGRTSEAKWITPGLIHIGQPIGVKQVLKRLEPSAHGAIDLVEGAIWRVEREGRVDFICKFVRPNKIDGLYLVDEDGNQLPPTWNLIL